ncbi:hypothetical protein LTR06_008904 [Exophiala xenobiotica]|nr:hypothetical protein LTR06_008904 [Exophiala xenobiotica]
MTWESGIPDLSNGIDIRLGNIVVSRNSGNPDYAPNSYTPLSKFRPDTASAPYKVLDPIVSRKPHFYHEVKLSDYDQARALYEKVMTSSTTTFTIQIMYPGQQCCIKSSYAKAIYDLLPEKKFDFSEVEKASKDAEKRTKTPAFMHSDDRERLVGMPVGKIYNM